MPSSSLKRPRSPPPPPPPRPTGAAEPAHPFPHNYLDSFETPPAAIADILPALRFLAAESRVSLRALRCWDPFFCAGSVAAAFAAEGMTLAHTNTDAYTAPPPPHDVVVTNPPYSADNKERALALALAQRKPFFLLLPAYCATKSYVAGVEFLFVAPRASPYTFAHPEGTGHATPPFKSMWFIGGVAPDQLRRLAQALRAARPHLVVTLDTAALVAAAQISGERRRNPRQRAAERKRAALGGAGGGGAGGSSAAGVGVGGADGGARRHGRGLDSRRV